jgi:hypothetical protein
LIEGKKSEEELQEEKEEKYAELGTVLFKIY